MSASILYKPHNPTGKRLPCVGSPSELLRKLKTAGYELPYTFREDDIQKLMGMSAMCDKEENPYQELVDLIEKYKEVDLWAEY